jgi:plastocyanin
MYMKRRDFLRTASGVTGAAAAAGAASAGAAAADGSQDSGAPENATTTTGTPTGTENGTGTGTGAGNETTSGDGGAAAGGTETVQVGPGGDYVYTPGTETPLYISPGTTVNFVWDSDNHNIVVDSQPDDANWEGHEPIENTGFEYSHTFDTLGEYTYFCQPHKNLGMDATIVVNESGANPNAGGGKEQDPEHMGVPFQAHFVGIVTILAIISSLLYTFYSLKYGESAHTAAPNKD